MYTKCKKRKYFHSNRTNFLQISDYLQATNKVSIGVTKFVGIVLAVNGEVEDRNMSNDCALISETLFLLRFILSVYIQFYICFAALFNCPFGVQFE